MHHSKPLVVIAGPTAVGKSRLALSLAQRWNASIINADSRQIYKYLDIGTNKPSPEELSLVPHYMIDIVYPDQFYSAGDYGREARKAVDNIIQSNNVPILVGGTGLYIRAVVNGLAPSPPSNREVKKLLRMQVQGRGIGALYEELLRIDPILAERFHPNDKQRILRALEVYFITGKRLSDFHKQSLSVNKYNTIFLFINRSREKLYDLINVRVEKMFEDGLIEEVERLLKMGYSQEDPGMQSLGYKYIIDYINGYKSLNDVKTLMKRDTRRYAKRQITWFSHERQAIKIDCIMNMDIIEYIPQIDNLLKERLADNKPRKCI